MGLLSLGPGPKLSLGSHRTAYLMVLKHGGAVYSVGKLSRVECFRYLFYGNVECSRLCYVSVMEFSFCAACLIKFLA